MNIILLEAHALDAKGKATLLPETQQHIRKVLKSEAGDVLKVGIIDGKKGMAQVLSGLSAVQLLPLSGPDDSGIVGLTPSELEEWLSPPTSEPAIDLFIALPRPKTFEKMLQYASAMSVRRMTFFAATRTELAYMSSPKLDKNAITRNVKLGLEQGGRTHAPQIFLYASLKRTLEQKAAFIDTDNVITLLAHPNEVEIDGKIHFPVSVKDCPIVVDVQSPYRRALLVLGPEGGFVQKDLEDIFAELPNVHLVSLGQNILRCEAAMLCLISQCQLFLPDSLPVNRAKTNRSVGSLNPVVTLPKKGRFGD